MSKKLNCKTKLSFYGLRLLALLLAPLLYFQGKSALKRIPRLPEASGPTQGEFYGSGQILELITIGESTVAGVGAKNHELAITGQLAKCIHQQTSRPVIWRAIGKNGMTAKRLVTTLLPMIENHAPDVIVIALGVNDVKAFRHVEAWQRDIENIINGIRAYTSTAAIVFSGVPQLSNFPALPFSLRLILGLHSKLLDSVIANSQYDSNVYHCPLLTPDGEQFFAEDGFHPSELGYQAWAENLSESVCNIIS